MSRPWYTKHASPHARAELMRLGAIMKLAQAGVQPEYMDPAMTLVKRSAIGPALDATAKTVVLGSVLTGIPVGIMAHMLAKKMTAVKRREREMQQKIDHYRTAATELESGLAQSGITA